MKTIKIITSIILLLFITISSCIKKQKPATTDVDGLPFATQTGANTFGCLIDGVPFSVSGAYSDWRYYGVQYTFSLDSILNIEAISFEPKKIINIVSKIDGNIPNSYKFNKDFFLNWSYASLGPMGTPLYGVRDSLDAKIEVLKYTGDRINGVKSGDFAIVAGTFEGEMQNAQGEKIKITKGRFDIKQNF
jgi:hypothetical protein